jgi:serine/threonine protein kinase
MNSIACLDAGTSDPRRAAPFTLRTRFHLREPLGQGGMGIVYRAYDTELAGDVALKTLTQLVPADVFQLKREFRSLADIRHPNLITLFELFADGRNCFFTMELIVGANLIAHLRRPSHSARFDERRYRSCARQLALAIARVHEADKLHRDIKPSNVLVTQAGRLVLLDFGLAVPIPQEGKPMEAGLLAGTPGYMAPEQLRGESLTPAADWYGFGATLFEVATGCLPFDHPVKAIAARPGDVPRARAHLPDFPEDLEQLIVELLAPAAKDRPDGCEVLRRLEPRSSVAPVRLVPPAPTSRPELFSRTSPELATLQAAFDETQRGSQAIARVHGPADAGKTALVRSFADALTRSGAAVLRSRCHPQESVPFNALDGVVDDLSHLLHSQGYNYCAALSRRDCEAVKLVFPVLGRLESSDGSVASRGLTGVEALRRATRALKELLFWVADRQPLVVWIDDAQWGDESSGALLTELLSPPRSPKMLLLLTYRDEDAPASAFLRSLATGEDG